MSISRDTALLDVNEVADVLNVKPSWVYANVDRLPTLRVGKMLRWRADDLDAWLDRMQNV